MDANVIKETTQYLTFTLGDEEFAIEITRTREIMDYLTITRVPGMAEFHIGVINLRGNVVPVIDLRLKLGMTAIQKTVETCIMIVEINMDGEKLLIGTLVDSVKEVVDFEPEQVAPPPRLGTRLKTEFIQGMGKRDEKFVIILNMDQVFSRDELVAVQHTRQGPMPDPVNSPREVQAIVTA